MLMGLPKDNLTFVNLNDLMALVQDIVAAKESGLVIVANKYERTAIDQIIQTNIKNTQNRIPFLIWLIRTPSFTPGEFEDFAVYTGSKYFSKERGDKLIECHKEDLGRTNALLISRHGEGAAFGGAGTEEAKKARIAELKQKRDDEPMKMMKDRLNFRISAISAAMGIIKVGTPSDGETEHVRLKVRNVVKSVQAAMSGGVVKGGGLALKQVAERLPDNMLSAALQIPYIKIQENAGGKLEIGKDVFDAFEVVKVILEQACSTAWLLINSFAIIEHRSEADRKDAAEIIAKAYNESKKPINHESFYE